MKILHIMRSEPDEMVRVFIRGVSKDAISKEVPLYQDNVDYDGLIKDIFENDQIISWW